MERLLKNTQPRAVANHIEVTQSTVLAQCPREKRSSRLLGETTTHTNDMTIVPLPESNVIRTYML